MMSPLQRMSSSEGMPWQTLVIQRRGNTAHCGRLLVYPAVDLRRGNARADVRRHIIQHRDVDLRALADARNLCFGLNHVVGGHDRAAAVHVVELLVKIEMAMLVFFAAAAPAGHVAIQLMHG